MEMSSNQHRNNVHINVTFFYYIYVGIAVVGLAVIGDDVGVILGWYVDSVGEIDGILAGYSDRYNVAGFNLYNVLLDDQNDILLVGCIVGTIAGVLLVVMMELWSVFLSAFLLDLKLQNSDRWLVLLCD